MRSLILGAAFVVLYCGPASAGCEFASVTDNCLSDHRGNTYRTEQTLGGGYVTKRNGTDYSRTEQTLDGGYTTKYPNGYQTFQPAPPAFQPYVGPSYDPVPLDPYNTRLRKKYGLGLDED